MDSGFLLIDKPSGWTSFDVVSHLKKVMRVKKIGHGGTLDPLAEGLLIVAFNRGTKFLSYIKDYRKVYRCRIYLGEQRDTDDREGKIIFKGNPSDILSLSEEEIRNVVSKYVGTFYQTVPKYSAVKKNGNRLYKMAREGKEFTLPKKKVTVDFIDILDISLPYIDIRTKVSSGTYIRALARDIGNDLKTGGYLYYLYRESIGPFDISHATPLKEISYNNVDNFVRPLNELFLGFPSIEIGDAELKRGYVFENTMTDGIYVIKQNGMREGIGINKNGLLKVERVFDENNI